MWIFWSLVSILLFAFCEIYEKKASNIDEDHTEIEDNESISAYIVNSIKKNVDTSIYLVTGSFNRYSFMVSRVGN